MMTLKEETYVIYEDGSRLKYMGRHSVYEKLRSAKQTVTVIAERRVRDKLYQEHRTDYYDIPKDTIKELTEAYKKEHFEIRIFKDSGETIR